MLRRMNDHDLDGHSVRLASYTHDTDYAQHDDHTMRITVMMIMTQAPGGRGGPLTTSWKKCFIRRVESQVI